MVYSRPEESIAAEWLPRRRARLCLNYQGRDWYREVGPSDFVTVLEAAALLGVSRSAPYQWIQQGRLPATQVEMTKGREVTVMRLGDLHDFARLNGYATEGPPRSR